MGKATTPAEGAVKDKVRIEAKKELGAEFDEAKFDDAFAEAYSEEATYQDVYDKAISILRSKDEPDDKEMALRKLARDAMDRKH